MKTPAILLGILFLAAFPVRAEDSGDRLQKVVTDVQQALDAKREAGTPAKDAVPMDVRAALAQLRSAVVGGETLSAESALDQLAVYLDAGPVRQECVELAATLRRERAAVEKKTLADITAALDRATTAVRAAKIPAELDPTVSELGQFGPNRGERMYDRFGGMSSRPLMTAMANAGAALRFVTQCFVTQWQDYLSEMADGDREKGNQTLRSLTQNEIYLIPRSEILARMHEYGTTTVEATPAPASAVPLGPVDRLNNPKLLGTARSAYWNVIGH